MDEPWLSVILPTYQGEAWVGRALGSLLDGGLADGEVVVVDDRSEDATLEIVRSFAGRLPIRVHRRAGERNWTAGTNEGLALARGRFGCFLHQDDFWSHERAAVLRRHLLAEPAPDLVLTGSSFTDPGGRIVGRWRCPLPAGAVDPERLHRRLLVQNFLAVSAPAFRTAFVRNLDLRLDESLWYTADWDFWLRLCRAGARTLYDPRPTVAFGLHGESQTVRRSLASDFHRQLEIVLERHLTPGVPRSVERAARASLEVNLALAAWAHGVRPGRGLLKALWMPPTSWARFLRDTRLLERTLPRLRVLGRLGSRRRRPQAPG